MNVHLPLEECGLSGSLDQIEDGPNHQNDFGDDSNLRHRSVVSVPEAQVGRIDLRFSAFQATPVTKKSVCQYVVDEIHLVTWSYLLPLMKKAKSPEGVVIIMISSSIISVVIPLAVELATSGGLVTSVSPSSPAVIGRVGSSIGVTPRV